MFDINLYPIAYVDGQEQGSLPGMYAASAPRRAARGRAGELLALYLTLQGNALFSPEGLQQMLERLSQLFFQTSGSVTMALRAAAETLNTYLLERNLKHASDGKQAIGLLNMLVVHGDMALIANCGPVHTFVMGDKAVEHFADPQQAGRGLGLARTLAVRFYQTELKGSPYFVLSAYPPSIWITGGLSAGPASSIDVIKRRLISQAQPNLAAVVVQLQPGSGKYTIIAGSEAARPVITSAAVPSPAAPAPIQPSQAAPAVPTAIQSSQAAPAVSPSPTVAPVTPAPVVQEPPPSPQPVLAPPPAAAPARSRRRPARVEPPAQVAKIKRPPVRPAIFRGLVRGMDAWSAFWRRIGESLRKLFGRLSPTGAQPSLRLPTSLMLFIAIAVPLVVVAVAMVVYLDRGRGAQFEYYFAQAQFTANDAVQQSQPDLARSAWRQTLALLNQAEDFKHSDETRALRRQAITALDTLDWVDRIDMQPAVVGELARSIQVTRIVALDEDLYLLDNMQGRVLHATLTNQGYEVDPNFSCNPGPVDGLVVGPLVDIIALPIGNDTKAPLMGIDRSGNLLLCTPGEPQVALSLAPPPQNWGQINRLRLFGYTLYVLDPQINGLYEFYGYDPETDRPSINFPDAAESFFGKNSPELEDAVDFIFDTQDIYLLHADGQLTHCLYSISELVDTTCDPRSAPADPRPGYDTTAPSFAGTLFNQMALTQPPVPSIYLLDAQTTNIYQFNMRLELHRVLALDQDTQESMQGQKATAFAIAANRMVFIALGNRVFYGFLP